MKQIILIGGFGAIATWFLWKAHKTFAYIVAVITAYLLFKSWRG